MYRIKLFMLQKRNWNWEKRLMVEEWENVVREKQHLALIAKSKQWH